MSRRTLWTRLALAALYFAATFSYLFYLNHGNTLCEGGNGPLIESIRLAIGCTAWTLFASFCGAIASQGLGRFFNISAISVTVIVALSGFASLPLWIYTGYGHFRFENIADVSCFFREDAGIVFFIIVAPVLTALTFLYEYLAQRITKKPTRATS
ncbi:MAG: hypothetical protein V4587_19935 [Acidobacteriota bacterium]